jgi:hypothetical protein
VRLVGHVKLLWSPKANATCLGTLPIYTVQVCNTAYTQGMGQFNTEQDRAQQAQDLTNRFGLSALGAQQLGGAQQRDIEGQGIAADYAQFQEERDFPFKQVQYQQSLLQDLPISAASTEFVGQSDLAEGLGYAGTIAEIYRLLKGDKVTK